MIDSMSLASLMEELSGELTGVDVEFKQVCTDSRNIEQGSLFVALSGERFDGHEYVEQAFNKGAAAALVERQQDLNGSQLRVDNVLTALGQLGAINRKQFKGPVVALTGSAGKTTTKEMLASIFREVGPVLATHANFNNEIGVPLTLLSLEKEHEYAVIELGARQEGDIRYLMSLVEPEVSLITNAMPAHIESFGNLDNVALSKAEVFTGLKAGGIAVINLDDQYASFWRRLAADHPVIGFSMQGNPQATVSARLMEHGQWYNTIKLLVDEQEREITLSVPGEHNVANALAAAAAAHAVGVDVSNIAAGLEKFVGVSGRMQLQYGIKGSKVIDDSYNANPGSVKSAIDVLSRIDGNKWLVLGDMAELGDDAEKLHAHIAEYAVSSKIDRLLCIGEHGKTAVRCFGEGAQHFSSRQDLLDYCRQHVSSQDVILVKGSRSAQMEKVAGQLLAAEGEQ